MGARESSGERFLASRIAPRHAVLTALLLFALALCAGCTSASTSRPADRASGTVVRITTTPSGCPPVPSRVPAGVVEVIATNLDAPTVSEVEIRTSDFSRVLGEKENLIEGMSARFSISIGAGDFVVNCPGASTSHWSLTATRGLQRHHSSSR